MLTAEIRYEEQEQARAEIKEFRLIYVGPDGDIGDVMVRGKPGGAWVLVNELV